MGCCLLFLTVLIGLRGGIIYSRLWLSYTLILVFLGGILVIFIYVALVSSNEQFSLTLKPLLFIGIIIPAFFFMPLAPARLKDPNLPISTRVTAEGLNWLKDIYSETSYSLTLFLVLYLFLTLIVVVSNTKDTKITLRSF